MNTTHNLPARFAERLQAILPEGEFDVFAQRCQDHLPKTARVADHIDAQALWGAEPLASIPGVYKLTDKSITYGLTLPHWTGQMYMQSLSSILPVLALNPEEGTKGLDMCAAPGSKTTLLAEKIGPEGAIVANELSSSRSKKLVANLNRLGVTNVMVTHLDGTKMPREYAQEFDWVLLDAPCSSEGFTRKSEKYLRDQWNENFIYQCSTIQRHLITAAFQLLVPGGEMVYSTCTTAPEENEATVQFLMDFYPGAVEIVPIEIPGVPHHGGIAEWGEQKFDTSIQQHAWRLYPHMRDNGWDSESFFVCKIRKVAPVKDLQSEPVPPQMPPVKLKKNAKAEAVVKLVKQFGIEREVFKPYTLLKQNESLYLTSNWAATLATKHRHKRVGLQIMDKDGNLTTEFALAFGKYMNKNIVQVAPPKDAERWLMGYDLDFADSPLDIPDGTQVVVRHGDYVLGTGKVLKSGKKVKNRVDRTLVVPRLQF